MGEDMAKELFENLCSEIQSVVFDACKKNMEANAETSNLKIDKEEIQIVAVNPRWGDFGTSFPLQLSARMEYSPFIVASNIANLISDNNDIFSKISATQNGYINFKIKDELLTSFLKAIISLENNYGKNELYIGKKVLVEYVSASPTGPMHIGNLRGGVIGDVLANVYRWSGAEVIREYYVNDNGDKLNRLALSIEAKYLLLYGCKDIEFETDWYQGIYVDNIAKMLSMVYGGSLCSMTSDERNKLIFNYAVKTNLKLIEDDLAKSGIRYDSWFYESELYGNNSVNAVIDYFVSKNYTYKKDGALWLKTKYLLEIINETREAPLSKKDDLTDDVLVKRNGEITYFAVDVAYHFDRITRRKMDKTIDILGSDQQGHDLRVKIALWALGIKDLERVEMVLVHMVNLMKDGKAMKMSRREDYAITVDQVVDSIGKDTIRYILGQQDYNCDLNFEYNSIHNRKISNNTNCVKQAYLQCCSILSQIDRKTEIDINNGGNLEQIERELIVKLMQFPMTILESVKKTNIVILFKYAESLSRMFHKYYLRIQDTNGIIIISCSEIVQSVKIVFENCADLLGYDLTEYDMSDVI